MGKRIGKRAQAKESNLNCFAVKTDKPKCSQCSYWAAWRSTLCEACWRMRCHAVSWDRSSTVRGRNANGEFCRPTQVAMTVSGTVGQYLEMPYWQIHDGANNCWVSLPLSTRPSHIVHEDQQMPAHKKDLLGMFGKEVLVVFSQCYEPGDAQHSAE